MEATLDLLRAFGGAEHLCMCVLHAVLFQEIITEPGIFFKAGHGWKLIHGKIEGEFRGPHHITVPEVETILHEWGKSRRAWGRLGRSNLTSRQHWTRSLSLGDW